MFVVSLISAWALLRLGKFLVPMSSGFVIPISSEMLFAVAMISFLCCPKLLLVMIALAGPLLSFLYFKRSSSNLILLKSMAYSISIIGAAFVDYSYYSTIESFVTGFLYPTPELISLSIIVFLLAILLKVFEYPINFSLFDMEYSQIKGLKPKLWLTLVYVSAAYVGAQLTFFQGFLLAHVTSLSLLVVGYLLRELRSEITALLVFAVVNYVSGIYLPLAYSSAVSSVALLLLWQAREKALPNVRKTLM